MKHTIKCESQDQGNDITMEQSKIFSKNAVIKLINLRGEKYKLQFSALSNNHNVGWRAVISEMGSQFDLKRTKKKWENLVYKYKHLKFSTNNSEYDYPKWEFYPYMDKVFDASLTSTRHQPSPSSLSISNASCSSTILPSTFLAVDKLSTTSKVTPPQRPTSSLLYNLNFNNVIDNHDIDNNDDNDNDDKKDIFLQAPHKKRKNSDIEELLEYLKKRDKKLIKQQKIMISLMKRNLEHNNISVLISSDSDSD